MRIYTIFNYYSPITGLKNLVEKWNQTVGKQISFFVFAIGCIQSVCARWVIHRDQRCESLYVSQYYNTNVHSAALLYDVAPTNSDTNSSDTRGAINILMAQIPSDSFHQFAFTFDSSNFKTEPNNLDEFNNPSCCTWLQFANFALDTINGKKKLIQYSHSTAKGKLYITCTCKSQVGIRQIRWNLCRFFVTSIRKCTHEYLQKISSYTFYWIKPNSVQVVYMSWTTSVNLGQERQITTYIVHRTVLRRIETVYDVTGIKARSLYMNNQNQKIET